MIGNIWVVHKVSEPQKVVAMFFSVLPNPQQAATDWRDTSFPTGTVVQATDESYRSLQQADITITE